MKHGSFRIPSFDAALAAIERPNPFARLQNLPTLPVPPKVELEVRQLSPEIVSEMRRVQGSRFPNLNHTDL